MCSCLGKILGRFRAAVNEALNDSDSGCSMRFGLAGDMHVTRRDEGSESMTRRKRPFGGNEEVFLGDARSAS